MQALGRSTQFSLEVRKKAEGTLVTENEAQAVYREMIQKKARPGREVSMNNCLGRDFFLFSFSPLLFP